MVSLVGGNGGGFGSPIPLDNSARLSCRCYRMCPYTAAECKSKKARHCLFCLRFFAACRYGDLFGFLYLRRKRRFFRHNFLPFVDYGDDVERRRFTRRGLVHDLHAFGKTVHLSGNRKLQR